jgi:CBS domain-containing protein
MAAKISQVTAGATDAREDEVGEGKIYRFLEYTAGQFMTHAVMTVTPRHTMRELEKLFETHDFNSFPVVEEGRMLGIVTKFDFLRTFAFTTGRILPHYDELMRRTVSEMMTEDVLQVLSTTPLTRVLELMVNQRTRSVPVVSREGRLVGIVSREDVMRALRQATQKHGRHPRVPSSSPPSH